LQIIGVLGTGRDEGKGSFAGYEVLGGIEELGDVCKRIPVDEVVFCLPKDYLPRVESYFRDVSRMGITYRMVLDFDTPSTLRRELSFFHGQIPMLSFYYGKIDTASLFLKRCMDVVGALVGLLITGVLFPVIALAIKLDSKGPVFFCQLRVGENGRIFRCCKFRSMCEDAENRKHQLIDRNKMEGALFKIDEDPRITRVGRFLRKTSLDELPQFWNVLKGEMSLVGTRPPTPEEVRQYEDWHRKRISIKPGITGLWQVSGRNQIRNFDEVARLDIDYIEKWSFWLDLKILTKTLGKVFFQWDGV
jgi:exopolysaccharide biosynthesis polyprenyl glycosylphosphotransferase